MLRISRNMVAADYGKRARIRCPAGSAMTIDVMWLYLYPGMAGLFAGTTPTWGRQLQHVEIGGPLLPAPGLACGLA